MRWKRRTPHRNNAHGNNLVNLLFDLKPKFPWKQMRWCMKRRGRICASNGRQFRTLNTEPPIPDYTLRETKSYFVFGISTGNATQAPHTPGLRSSGAPLAVLTLSNQAVCSPTQIGSASHVCSNAVCPNMVLQSLCLAFLKLLLSILAPFPRPPVLYLLSCVAAYFAESFSSQDFGRLVATSPPNPTYRVSSEDQCPGAHLSPMNMSIDRPPAASAVFRKPACASKADSEIAQRMSRVIVPYL